MQTDIKGHRVPLELHGSRAAGLPGEEAFRTQSHVNLLFTELVYWLNSHMIVIECNDSSR